MEPLETALVIIALLAGSLALLSVFLACILVRERKRHRLDMDAQLNYLSKVMNLRDAVTESRGRYLEKLLPTIKSTPPTARMTTNEPDEVDHAPGPPFEFSDSSMGEDDAMALAEGMLPG